MRVNAVVCSLLTRGAGTDVCLRCSCGGTVYRPYAPLASKRVLGIANAKHFDPHILVPLGINLYYARLVPLSNTQNVVSLFNILTSILYT